MQKPLSKQKIIHFIAAFLLGLGTPILATMLTTPLYGAILSLLNLGMGLLQQLFLVSGSAAIVVLLQYSIFSFGFLFAPSISALLFGFRTEPNRNKFLVLATQMLIYYGVMYFTHWLKPLCIGNDCLLASGNSAVLSPPEQSYLATTLPILALVQIVIGSYIGSYNPLGKCLGAIWSFCRKRSSKKDSLSTIEEQPKEYVISLYPFLASISWAPVLLGIIAVGIIVLPSKNFKWALNPGHSKVLNVYIETQPKSANLFKESYVGFAMDALYRWEYASKGAIKFQRVNNKVNCHICIDWVPFNTSNPMDLIHLGLTYSHPDTSNFEYMQKADITVKSQNVPDNVIRKVLAHEIGHALGLEHTQNHSDIMFHNVAVTKEERAILLSTGFYLPILSPGDIQALLAKYPVINQVPAEKSLKAQIYRRYAQMGDASAASYLGSLYERGDGVPINYTEAFKWYKFSAEHGDSFGQHNLARLYRLGKGVKADDYAAGFWYEKSAGQGNPWGLYRLAQMYQDSKGGLIRTPDLEFSLYQKAADQGYSDAQYALGICYRNGYGVDQDLVESYKWFSIATDVEHADAAKQKALLEKTLSTEQIKEAERRVDAWNDKLFPSAKY